MSLRWFFRCGTWNPTQAEWLNSVSVIQAEERKRVNRFVFQRDCKSAMAGRLLMRKAVCCSLKLGNNSFRLARTKRQKPYLITSTNCQATPAISVSDCNDELLPPESEDIHFNISHQGVYAVLAAEADYIVGVDVMRVDEPGSGIVTFFDRMSRQFTYTEWKFIKTPDRLNDQLSRFYRLWTLKESYVKATGTGISVDLQTLNFNVGTAELDVGVVATNTTVEVEGRRLDDWRFEESRLDQQHWAAVALQVKHAKNTKAPYKWPQNLKFEEKTFVELTQDLTPLDSDIDLDFWQNFAAKDENPAARNTKNS